jgi:predicted  nucleic acid-binding Zn-ribbon protein
MNEQTEDLLPFYALGTLTEAEGAQVETGLADHPQTEAELKDARYAVSALAYAALPTNPSPRIKQEIMARVEAEAASEAPAAGQTSHRLADFINSLGFRSGWGLAMPALAAASLVVALIAGIRVVSLNAEVAQLRRAVASVEDSVAPLQSALIPLRGEIAALQTQNTALEQEVANQRGLIENFSTDVSHLQQADSSLEADLSAQSQDLAAVTGQLAVLSQDKVALTTMLTKLSGQSGTLDSLQAELGRLRVENGALLQELSSQREIMAYATSPDSQSMIILGTEKLPQARGQLIANPTSDAGVLIVSGLPPLEAGLVYKFWLVQDGTPLAVGDINVDARGLGTLVVTSGTQIGSFEAMGVSIEPIDADPQPAHEMIMLGSFS